ncbi:hypothetical protein DPSP01_014321 [Paraphaeosphaeria sporulosa]
MNDRFRETSARESKCNAQYPSMNPSYNDSQPNTLPAHNNGQQYPSLYIHHSSNSQTPVTTTADLCASNPPVASQHHHLRPLQPPPSYLLTSAPYSQAPLLPTSDAQSNVLWENAVTAGPRDVRTGVMGSFHLPALSNQDFRTACVVGRQGRRGVLPVHPGRPSPAVHTTVTNPIKNDEGKYECPHCNKSYLHLKHLKRHLLRRKHRRAPVSVPSMQGYVLAQ